VSNVRSSSFLPFSLNFPATFSEISQKTFDELTAWKKAFLIQVGQENSKNFPILVLANKVDLPDRQVSKKDVGEWARANGDLRFYETSAKEGVNVGKAFEDIAKMAFANVNEADMKIQTVKLDQKPNGGGCC
jgi:GTPase SAR1 family protein